MCAGEFAAEAWPLICAKDAFGLISACDLFPILFIEVCLYGLNFATLVVFVKCDRKINRFPLGDGKYALSRACSRLDLLIVKSICICENACETELTVTWYRTYL